MNAEVSNDSKFLHRYTFSLRFVLSTHVIHAFRSCICSYYDCSFKCVCALATSIHLSDIIHNLHARNVPMPSSHGILNKRPRLDRKSILSPIALGLQTKIVYNHITSYTPMPIKNFNDSPSRDCSEVKPSTLPVSDSFIVARNMSNHQLNPGNHLFAIDNATINSYVYLLIENNQKMLIYFLLSKKRNNFSQCWRIKSYFRHPLVLQSRKPFWSIVQMHRLTSTAFGYLSNALMRWKHLFCKNYCLSNPKLANLIIFPLRDKTFHPTTKQSIPIQIRTALHHMLK